MRSKPMSPVSFIPMVKPDIRPLALTYKTKNQYIQKTITQATKIPSWHKRQRYMIYVHSRLFYLQCCHWFPAEKKWNVSWHLLKVGNNGRTRRPSHSNVWPHNGFFPLWHQQHGGRFVKVELPVQKIFQDIVKHLPANNYLNYYF